MSRWAGCRSAKPWHSCPPLTAPSFAGYYQGSTTAQIAEDLPIGEHTVKSRRHHTLRALRRTLQEMEAPHRRVR
jgi:hypothetical protein